MKLGLMREAGLEPATSRLSAGCSNRLSYPRLGNSADSQPRHKSDGITKPRIKGGQGRTMQRLLLQSLFFQTVYCYVRRQVQYFLKVT